MNETKDMSTWLLNIHIVVRKRIEYAVYKQWSVLITPHIHM